MLFIWVFQNKSPPSLKLWRAEAEKEGLISLIPKRGVPKPRDRKPCFAAVIFLCLYVYECTHSTLPDIKKAARQKTDSDPCFAEKEGFEPPVPLPVHRISSAARSTTLALLPGCEGSKVNLIHPDKFVNSGINQKLCLLQLTNPPLLTAIPTFSPVTTCPPGWLRHSFSGLCITSLLHG